MPLRQSAFQAAWSLLSRLTYPWGPSCVALSAVRFVSVARISRCRCKIVGELAESEALGLTPVGMFKGSACTQQGKRFHGGHGVGTKRDIHSSTRHPAYPVLYMRMRG